MRRKPFSWEINPIIVKELRSRMRGSRAFSTLTGTLLALGIFSYAMYRVVLSAVSNTGIPASPQIGQALFAGLVFLELFIIAALVPSITSGAISGEKERLTYEMLLTTPLHPARVLWGKLISALGYVVLLIFAAVPLTSLVFIYGGVSIREVVKAFLILGTTAVFFGVIGLFFSALFGRSGRASAATYLAVSLLMFGPILAAGFSGIIRQSEPPRWMLVASPITALGSAIIPSLRMDALFNMYWMLSSFQWVIGAPQISYTSFPRPIYHFSLPLFGLFTLLLYLASTRLVLPTHRWRLQWAEILAALALILGFTSLAALGYLTTTNRYENIKVITAGTEEAYPAPMDALEEPSLLYPVPEVTPP